MVSGPFRLVLFLDHGFEASKNCRLFGVEIDQSRENFRHIYPYDLLNILTSCQDPTERNEGNVLAYKKVSFLDLLVITISFQSGSLADMNLLFIKITDFREQESDSP